MKVSPIHINSFIDYARMKGMQWTGDVVDDLSPTQFFSAVREITDFVDDDLLGVRIGHLQRLHTLRLVYDISLRTGELGEALCYRHNRLQQILPMIKIERSQLLQDVSYDLTISDGDERASRCLAEAVLSVMAMEIGLMSGCRSGVRIVSPYRNDDYPDEWQMGDRFRIITRICETELKHFRSIGLNLIIPEYLKQIDELNEIESFTGFVKSSILRLAHPVLPDLDTTSYAMNIAPRSLQRRLMKEGSSFRQICDDIKRTSSDLLLSDRSLDVNKISMVLGYSEPAAYIHACMKWHGKSPSELRSQMP